MGLFTKLTKKSLDVLNTKGVKKAAVGADRNIKDFVSSGIKSTPAIGSQGATQATAGGFKAGSVKTVSKFAQGLTGTSKIGGRVLGYSAVAAVPVGVGVAGYTAVKDAAALTDEDRRFKFLVDQEEKIRQMPSMSPDNDTSGNPYVDDNPTAIGNSGLGMRGGLSPSYDLAYGDSGSKEKAPVEDSGMGGLGLFGIAAVVAGGAYFLKKRKKST